ncbi:MAG: GNAT family N-acetyltransferase [Pseudomonadales bacterium]|nr:GNAT family N-acetyltransferase [Pseudomonadales bacterium]
MDLPALQTERLWLRGLALQDAADLHVAFGDAECMRWWHRPPTRSLDETAGVVADMIERDAGHWVFGEQGSQEVLGHVGFVSGLARGAHAGFGYGMRRAYWGRGYAVEAARAALAFGFDETGIERAEFWIHAENLRSIRVAEKLGCLRRSEALLGYEIGPTPSVIYGLTAQQWRGEQVSPPMHYGVLPVLPVRDVRAAAEWWRDVLGFHISFMFGEPPQVARVIPDPPWAGMGGVQLSRAEATQAGHGHVFVMAGPDIDSLAQRAIDAGGQVAVPLGDRPWGMREIELRDPDGNSVRLSRPA